MILPKPSSTNDSNEANGFTLLELLVVMAVMGLILMAIPAVFFGVRSGTNTKAIASGIANDLRQARNRAVMTNREVTWKLNSKNGRYLLPFGKRQRVIPDGVTVKFIGPDGSVGVVPLSVRFYADGSSTGVDIGLTSGNYEHRIAVDWLSGRVVVYE